MDTLTPGIGHNQPPLAEVLAEEIAPLKERAADLIDQSTRAVIVDDDTAGRATALAGLMKDHLKVIEKARVERKEPFLEAGRMVDRTFNGIAETIAVTDAKGRIVGGPLGKVIGLIDAYRQEQDRKADAERRRLEEEARLAREAQARAERERQEAEARAVREREEAERRIREAEERERNATSAKAAAEAQRDRERAEAQRRQQEAADREARMQADIAARQAAEDAARLEREAKATETRPIDSWYGYKAGGRKVITVEITDEKKAIATAYKLNKAPIIEAVLAVLTKQARAGNTNLPGAEIKESSSTTIRGAA